MLNHHIKIEYQPDKNKSFIMTAYYGLNEEQYKTFRRWHDNGFQTWIFDEYFTITEKSIKVTEIDYDPNIYKYSGCNMLENIPEFIKCGFFNKDHVDNNSDNIDCDDNT